MIWTVSLCQESPIGILLNSMLIFLQQIGKVSCFSDRNAHGLEELGTDVNHIFCKVLWISDLYRVVTTWLEVVNI